MIFLGKCFHGVKEYMRLIKVDGNLMGLFVVHRRAIAILRESDNINVFCIFDSLFEQAHHIGHVLLRRAKTAALANRNFDHVNYLLSYDLI